MNIKWMSREAAEAYRGKEPYAMISLTCPSSPIPDLPYEDPLCVGIIRFKVSDVDQHMLDLVKEAGMKIGTMDHYQNGWIVPFTPDLARDAANFVKAVAPEVTTFVCHCEAGISRSAGMAAALAVYFNGPHADDRMYHRAHPNSLIRSLMLEALTQEPYIGGGAHETAAAPKMGKRPNDR